MTKRHVQKHTHTFVEQVVHAFLGYLVTIVAIMIFKPDVTLVNQVAMFSLALTMVKFVVHYCIRRAFTHYSRRK